MSEARPTPRTFAFCRWFVLVRFPDKNEWRQWSHYALTNDGIDAEVKHLRHLMPMNEFRKEPAWEHVW